MSKTTAATDLLDWFRHIGTGLSDSDYEDGIMLMAAHDAEVRRDEREKVAAEIEANWKSKPPIPSRAESESANDYLEGVRFGKIIAARIARGGAS